MKQPLQPPLNRGGLLKSPPVKGDLGGYKKLNKVLAQQSTIKTKLQPQSRLDNDPNQ